MTTTQDERWTVVGVDGSPEAVAAARWATLETRRRGGALRLVAVVDQLDGHVVGLPALGLRLTEIGLESAARNLDAAEAAVRALAPELEVDRVVLTGFPIGALVAESRRAGLLVVGGTGNGRVAAILAGSVAAGAAAHAECPVVIVRGDEHAGAQPAPIVVGVDATGSSESAIAFAFEAAATREVPLLAVHTWASPPADLRTAPIWSDWEAEAERELAERLAGWGEKYPDVPVRRIVGRSRPATTLLELAEKAQLVVVGSRGHGELAGLVLGSVSNAVVHRSACPVAVVRPGRQSAR
ncbi:universal stress protein [Actinomycetes bacterium KLBMP 9759]